MLFALAFRIRSPGLTRIGLNDLHRFLMFLDCITIYWCLFRVSTTVRGNVFFLD